MRLRTTLRLTLITALTLIVVGLAAASFQRKLATFQSLGFELEAQGGVWRVAEVDEPRVGLVEGDEIFLVDGERPSDIDHLRGLLAERPTTQLMVKRGTLLEGVTYQRPPTRIDAVYLVLAGIGLLYLLIGLYTASRDIRGPAFLFFLWCSASAALYILSPTGVFGDALDRLLFLGDRLARLALPPLTVHLFLFFPDRLEVVRRRRWLVPTLYLPGAFLALFHGDLIFGGSRLFARPEAALLARVDRFELVLLMAGVLAASFLLWLRYQHGVNWEQRRQLLLVLVGLLGGYAPFLLFYVVPWVLSLSWPGWTTLVAVLPLALVPLTLAWAILRYKLLDIGSMLRDGLSVAFTALLAVFGFSLANLAIRSGVAEELSMARNLLTFASGLAIAGVLAPTRDVIARGLEHLRHRGHIGQRLRLRELGHELLYERDLDNLGRLLVDHLSEALVARVELYLVQGGAMVPMQPRDELPRQLPFDAFGTEVWERDAGTISAVDLVAEASPRQRLFAVGLRYAFPLTVRGHRIGMALVGYKFDEEPLDSEDVDLARGLLNQASLAIENAQLLEEVHRKLHEVIQLEERNQGILESSPAGIVVLDRDDAVVSANHAFAAIAGTARRDLIGLPCSEAIPVAPLPNPGDGVLEVSFCMMSGEERHLQLSIASYRHEAEHGLRVLIVQDISERVAMEMTLKEKERLASLGMLAAGVAHEVNTPLTGISSYAQLLLADTDSDDPRRQILEKMERQTFRAAQIVNNLLEFSRNRRDELHPLGLTELVDESLSLLEDRALAAGVTFDWQRPEEAMKVLGHEGELHQVVTNLVVNAIDALAGAQELAERRVAVSLETYDRRIRLQVADTGPGIPAERLERIFHPFFSTKVGKGGTGLGLAITYNIVRRHGGEMRAENHSGAPGCRFIVDLPRADRV